ncbi:MAG: FAD-dependent oxidoreductase [Clostridia bacterium]|nr:FAD-dependent oxidoreductase [Clostridia bacterium]
MIKKYDQEIEQAYNAITVMEEAQRCLLCLDAPCSKACPAGTDPAKFIRSVRFMNYKGAAETIRENNALGSICARVCPTEKYCQLGCSRCGIDKPIDIGGIQRFVTDFEQSIDMDILEKGEANGKKIAIIGSGPAGLQAAASLLSLGYAVDIFEKSAKAGGYLKYGIPEYRLPDYIVDYEIKRIEKLGASIKLNMEVGKDVSMDELKSSYDAVLVAIGASEAKMLPMFEGSPIVETAVSFLARAKENMGKIDLEQNVLVIGGGDVAMDVVTTLKLLGVKNVTDVVYEEFCEFLASKKELEGAQSVGVTIIDGYVPEKLDGNTVVFKHRHIDSELKITVDKIILAVGQKVSDNALGLNIVKNEVDFDGYHVDGSNVFVAGDIAHGDKTVVWAVKKGKEAAQDIHNFLGGKAL